uniref:Uncharacterized protein n=1 Tax=Musa acuminata subsp. malaccensis TaxID=214687 RepID=A0A804JK90_MUSAM
MRKRLQLLSLLVNHLNYVMEVLLQIRLNIDKSLASYSTWLSPVQIFHLPSINYRNSCIDHLLRIGLRSNEFCDILKGLLIMAFFFAKILHSISMLLLMLIGQGTLMTELLRPDTLFSLELFQSVGVQKNKRRLHDLQLKLNIVPSPPRLLNLIGSQICSRNSTSTPQLFLQYIVIILELPTYVLIQCSIPT